MDFKKTVNSEADEKYINIINGTTPSPYKQKPIINNQEKYKENRKNFYDRLKAEKIKLNNAETTVRENVFRRARKESQIKDERANRKIKRRLIKKGKKRNEKIK